MVDNPIYIPENCYRTTIVREFRAEGIRLFFRFDLPGKVHTETSIALINSEHAKSIAALFYDWALIETNNMRVVYERDIAR